MERLPHKQLKSTKNEKIFLKHVERVPQYFLSRGGNRV